MDPPIPPDVVETLDVAEADLRLLNFKYAALAAASAKHPAAAERNGNDGNGGDIGTARDGGADVTALTEADLGGLLDQHVRHGKTLINVQTLNTHDIANALSNLQ